MWSRPLAFAVGVALLSVTGLEGSVKEPSLVAAVKSGNREAVQAILRKKPDVNAAEPDGTTALDWAVRADDADMVRLLLAAGGDVSTRNRYGITPLAVAATNGSAKVMAPLLDAGADVNTQLEEGETVLMRTARTGRVDAIRLLIERGADVNAVEQSLGETALMWAAAENHPDAVKVLIEAGADPNARSHRETRPIRYVSQAGGGTRVPLPRGWWTALMYAARQDAKDSARALAESGADLNLVDPDGATALMEAIINAHYDLAAILLGKGADPRIADSQGTTPLYAAIDMHTQPAMTDRPPRRNTDTLDALKLVTVLLDHGADPNAQLKGATLQRHFNVGNKALGAGTTPLMRAAHAGDVAAMRLLLSKGASPFLTQKNHTTALMLAAGLAFRNRGDDDEAPDGGSEQAAIDALKVCLDAGIDIDAFNDDGETAMHAAVNRGDATVKFLAEQGAALDIKDKRGKTPLDLATATGSTTMPALLRDLVKQRTHTVATPARPQAHK
jgi:ankyrin repeat protein